MLGYMLHVRLHVTCYGARRRDLHTLSTLQGIRNRELFVVSCPAHLGNVTCRTAMRAFFVVLVLILVYSNFSTGISVSSGGVQYLLTHVPYGVVHATERETVEGASRVGEGWSFGTRQD